jgi:hypothetical protein
MTKRIFAKAFELTREYFPWNFRSALFTIVSTIIFFIGRWQILGRGIAIQYMGEILVDFVVCLFFVLVFLFLINIVRAPYQIIKVQDVSIKLLNEKKDREIILIDLETQRRLGVAIRNRGINLLSEKSASEWWQDHLDWRSKTAEIIEFLNKEKAERWKTLDRYTPTNSYPTAITPEHRHHLQMFDEWLLRLSKVTDDLARDKI